MATKTVPVAAAQARLPLNEGDFMAGVALFDDLLREAERRAFSDDEAERNSMNIDAEFRDGRPLSLFALPFLESLAQRPELAAGFAAALGDYVGMPQEGLGPGPGAQYDMLTFDDFTRTAPKIKPLRHASIEGGPTHA